MTIVLSGSGRLIPHESASGSRRLIFPVAYTNWASHLKIVQLNIQPNPAATAILVPLGRLECLP